MDAILNFSPKPTTNQEIIDLIQEGKSYNDIIAVLRVSPSRISIIKKRIKLKLIKC